MPGPKLRRCAICKRFHASHLVPEFEHGKGYLCYDCWQAWQGDAGMRARLTSQSKDVQPEDASRNIRPPQQDSQV